MTHPIYYHLGFGRDALGERVPKLAFLSGDPQRAAHVAQQFLREAQTLSEHRGLNSYLARLPSGEPVLSATSGMGAPSLSIVENELRQLGVETIIRIGTCGSIQEHVLPGSVVISSAALCRQGAADDVAPPEYPAAGDPEVTITLRDAARELGLAHHVGITASVDTFFEGQERTDTSANPHLLRRLQGITAEYRNLRILNYEMEAGTLFKMASVYGFAAGCVCGVVAQRTASESVVLDAKGAAVDAAIQIAVRAAETLLARSASAASGDPLERLMAEAKQAASAAYAPYSNFRVGAAILADDGSIYRGCNVENASYGLTICAERNAAFQLAAAGRRRIEAIAIYTPTATPTAPCGACRQVLREFGGDELTILSACDGDHPVRHTLAELLPDSFGPANLAADGRTP
jgi:uridine phosphorylase